MLLLIISIFLFILSIIFIYIGTDSYEDWLGIIGVCLALVIGVSLIIEISILIFKPIDYKNFKIEYDVVKETITNSEDIRDTNYTQKLIEINTEISKHKEYIDSCWIGIFFNKNIAQLELLEK